MRIEGEQYHTIWLKEDNDQIVQVFDQRKLPHEFIIQDLRSYQDAVFAIKDMVVRGAPLIGVTAAYGLYLACLENTSNDFLKKSAQELRETRPTAVNLMWAIDSMMELLLKLPEMGRALAAKKKAGELKAEDIEICRNIGLHGLSIIEELYQKYQRPINILTHCNAGWLATTDWGTATSPIYHAFKKGIPVHVWVDETRPRNQGAHLTAYELLQEEVPHTLIVDNVGGHLMQHGMVDLVIVGTDRTTSYGDVANKIGTYLKALAAHDNGVPFYVALPSSTIDWEIKDGLREIPIEQRSQEEVTTIAGWTGAEIQTVGISPKGTPAANYGFDVTPARLVTGLITERGVCSSSEEGLLSLFPERQSNG